MGAAAVPASDGVETALLTIDAEADVGISRAEGRVVFACAGLGLGGSDAEGEDDDDDKEAAAAAAAAPLLRCGWSPGAADMVWSGGKPSADMRRARSKGLLRATCLSPLRCLQPHHATAGGH